VRLEAAPFQNLTKRATSGAEGRSTTVVGTAEAAVATWIVPLQAKIPTSPKLGEKWGTLAEQDLLRGHPENIVLTHTLQAAPFQNVDPDPNLRFHGVVGAVAAFSTYLENIFNKNRARPVDFSGSEPTYQWRLGNDDRRRGS
jgi:hypothetical protein